MCVFLIWLHSKCFVFFFLLFLFSSFYVCWCAILDRSKFNSIKNIRSDFNLPEQIQMNIGNWRKREREKRKENFLNKISLTQYSNYNWFVRFFFLVWHSSEFLIKLIWQTDFFFFLSVMLAQQCQQQNSHFLILLSRSIISKNCWKILKCWCHTQRTLKW